MTKFRNNIMNQKSKTMKLMLAVIFLLIFIGIGMIALALYLPGIQGALSFLGGMCLGGGLFSLGYIITYEIFAIRKL